MEFLSFTDDSSIRNKITYGDPFALEAAEIFASSLTEAILNEAFYKKDGSFEICYSIYQSGSRFHPAKEWKHCISLTCFRESINDLISELQESSICETNTMLTFSKCLDDRAS